MKKFVMVDGLDGSGKGIVVSALKEWALSKNLKVLDLREYWKDNSHIPEFKEVSEYDAFASVEPTYAYIGKAIREEIIRDNTNKYSALSTAMAYALDREVLYKRLLIPALKAGKFIFQERGVITSIVYQPVQERIPLSEILRLPGNRLALQNAPSLLIITQVAPEVAVDRFTRRAKQDASIFENLFFQRKVEERYNSQWLKQLFERIGTRVVYLDTSPPRTVEDTKQQAIKLWEEFYQQN